jgi:hypothetical protein
MVPFLITVLTVLVVEPLRWKILSFQSQLLFTPLVLGITAIADILTVLRGNSDLFLQIVALLTALLVTLAGAFYGVHFAAVNLGGGEKVNVVNFFKASVIMTGVSVISTSVIQFKIAQSEPSSYA